ncbi:MAG: alpha/beta fold hydrolase [Calditrichaeota bacterium]|nr:MAG: alpha/beta fold hydrolase [Calditrichota bacterium]
MSNAVSIVLSILFLSFTGVLTFFIIFHYQLQKAFRLPHVDCLYTPRDFNMKCQEHRIEIKDHKNLQLWEIDGKDSDLLFLGFSGWNKAADVLLPVTTRLRAFGRVFLLNTRNHCGSSDSPFLSIVSFRNDVQDSLAFIRKKYPEKRIVLVGHGYAAAVALYVQSMDTGIDGLILSAVFPDLEEVVRQRFLDNKVPASFLDNMTRFVEFRAGERFERVAPKRLLHLIRRPVMLYGEHDTLQILPDNPYIFKDAGRFLDRAYWVEDTAFLRLKKFIDHLNHFPENLQQIA